MPRLFTSLLLAVGLWQSVCACADDRADIAASTILWNGSTQCSATIISKGPTKGAGVGASHCFEGHIGGVFRVGYCDGSTSPATLVAYDPAVDLSLFTVPADAVLGVAPIPEVMPTPKLGYGAVGMPNGRGPTYRGLVQHANTGTASQTTAARWLFDVEGTIEGGFSGGGVFVDHSKLCSVTSERSTNDGGRVLYSTTHKQLSEFVKKNAAKLKDCGEFFCYQQQPDADAPPAPKREGKPIAPPPKSTSPRWTPTPNVKLPPIPKAEQQNSNTFKDEAATEHIRKLELRVADLESRLLALESQTPVAPVPPLTPIVPKEGPTGPRGLVGETGPKGSDGKPGVTTIIVKWSDGTPIGIVEDVPSGRTVIQPLSKKSVSAKVAATK